MNDLKDFPIPRYKPLHLYHHPKHKVVVGGKFILKETSKKHKKKNKHQNS